MNGLQRIATAVQFQATDRVPVIAQVFGHAARFCGVPLDNYLQDGNTLASCQLKAWERYGYDAVFSVMDANVETEALGAPLRYSENQYPVVERYPLSPEASCDGLTVPDPEQAGRMPEMLKALAVLRREAGDKVAVIGCVLGPFTLASQLLGLEKALYLAVDDPARWGRFLDFATEVAIRFGQAQMQAGAHLPMVFDPAASPAVIPAAVFREFELPRLERLFQAFAQAGAMANWLHIAGPAAPILPYYPKAGVQIANFDYPVSAPQVRQQLPATCVDGNIKPLLFVDGSPAEIAAESAALLDAFRNRGGFILSSGCEIPPEAKPDNIVALVQAAGNA
jgi:uroporphyrinogen decarboxylase